MMNTFDDLGAAMRFENELDGCYHNDLNMETRFNPMPNQDPMRLLEKKPA